MKIHEHGFFIGNSGRHYTDMGLLKSLPIVLSDMDSVVDLGCGDASYSKHLSDNGFEVEAYDGNPDVKVVSNGFAKQLDISEPFDLGKTFDVVICLEVLEHIPEISETIVLDNLIKHAKSYIILSWAIPGQGGRGHINEKSNEYVRNEMLSRGFSIEEDVENYLRDSIINCNWFKNTIMVFKKN